MASGELLADGSRPDRSAQRRGRTVAERLERRYPDIGTALDYRSPWELIVATVLSAQTTDDNVNKVMPVLMDAYPDPADLAAARPDDVEAIIFSTGFFRQKTKSIIGLAAAVDESHSGEIPPVMADLVKLPGVGRKTASVVLAEAFGQPAIAVDTHVKRVSGRLGLTLQIDPVKVEQDLKGLIPHRHWNKLSMRLIQFGRDVCDARRPHCWECPLEDICEWPDKVPGP